MAPRPNILWICTEHHRFDTIHALNNSLIRTPNLDRLVGEGVAFTRAYVQSPVCMPSRASFFSGTYPANTGVTRNGQDIHDHVPLFPKELADAGYDCGLSGKFHVRHAFYGWERREADGFRMFEYSHGLAPGRAGDYELWLHEQGTSMDEMYEPGVLQSRCMNDRRLHQTTWCFDHAERFIREQRDRPWLMTVHPFAAHDPYDYLMEYYRRYDPDAMPTPTVEEEERARMTVAQQSALAGNGFEGRAFDGTTEHERRQMVAAYYATIEHIDAELGRLLDLLESRGERENTLVVFMADHGDMLGDHGIFAKGPFFYEPLVRVPLIFSWPGTLPSGKRIDALVEMVDLAPTLYELIGMRPAARFQGESLAPLMRGETADTRREGVYAMHYAHDLADGSATMWRDERYKIVVRHNQPYGELYDLQDDPGEVRNLWGESEYEALKAQLMQRCFDAHARTVDTDTVGRAGF